MQGRDDRDDSRNSPMKARVYFPLFFNSLIGQGTDYRAVQEFVVQPRSAPIVCSQPWSRRKGWVESQGAN
jgi:hypothetical protein